VSVRLEWDGKPTQIERLSLPFQIVETINESRATRERDTGSLLAGEPSGSAAHNMLVWGDNKLVMSSLLKEYAGQTKLVYTANGQAAVTVTYTLSRPGREPTCALGSSSRLGL